jgi:hypothetical protein
MGGTEDLDKSMLSGPLLRQVGGKIKDVLTGRKREATVRRTRKRYEKSGSARVNLSESTN